MMGTRAKTIGLHVLGWILFFSLIAGFIIYSPQAELMQRLLTPAFLLFAFVYITVFYLNACLLIPKFYLRRKYLAYFAILLVLFLVVYFLKPFDSLASFHKPLEPPFRRGPHFGGMPGPLRMRRPETGKHFDIVSIVLFVAVWSVSTALQILKQWRHTERRVLKAEAEKVSAELSFLKAQIHPHFLFNTLNNIYSLAIVKSESTPDAILKLSRILRYVTDDALLDFVPLKTEVECVNNYIDLQKLRLTNKVDIELAIRGALEQKTIAPLVFMTFIENAFKYGVSSHEPCVISINMEATETAIHFFCQNKIVVQESNVERTGVGINNAKKRLNYLYPGKHSLNINTENGIFTVRLAITA